VPSPVEFQRWPIVRAFTWHTYVPEATEQFKAFLSAHDVGAIVATDQQRILYEPLLASLSIEPVATGDIWLYRLPIRSKREVKADLTDMSKRFDSECLASLVTIAEKYLSDGSDLGSLSMLKVQQLGMIPSDSLIGPLARIDLGAPYNRNVITDAHNAYGAYLGEMFKNRVGVGVYAWYPAVEQLIHILRGTASGTYFPYRDELRSIVPPPDTQDGWLLVTFTRAQLAHATTLLSAETNQRTPSRARDDADLQPAGGSSD
jgi:hypothetical protein